MTLDFVGLELTNPARLVLLAVLPVLIYYFYRSLVDFPRWQRAVSLAVRSVIVLLLVLSLAGLTWLHATRDKFVVFVVDRSHSIGRDGDEAVNKLLKELSAEAQNHRTAYLPFAAEPGQWQSELPAADDKTAEPESDKPTPAVVTAAQNAG